MTKPNIICHFLLRKSWNKKLAGKVKKSVYLKATERNENFAVLTICLINLCRHHYLDLCKNHRAGRRSIEFLQDEIPQIMAMGDDERDREKLKYFLFSEK